MASLLQLRLHPGRRELRTFGLAGAILLLAATALRFRLHLGWQTGTGAGAALLLAALALAAPSLLRPIYVALSIATWPIGWVVSHLLLGVLFYALLTPIGLLFRLIGRDRMAKKRDPDAKTYFTPRPPAKDKRGYFRQY